MEIKKVQKNNSARKNISEDKTVEIPLNDKLFSEVKMIFSEFLEKEAKLSTKA